MKKCILLLTVLSSFFLGLSAMEEPQEHKAPSVLLMMRMRNAWFVQSVAKSKITTATTLLSFGINVNFQDGTGRTALHYAAVNDLYDLAEILLNMGADTSIEDNEENTAFMLAQKAGRSRVALLIEHAH